MEKSRAPIIVQRTIVNEQRLKWRKDKDLEINCQLEKEVYTKF